EIRSCCSNNPGYIHIPCRICSHGQGQIPSRSPIIFCPQKISCGTVFSQEYIPIPERGKLSPGTAGIEIRSTSRSHNTCHIHVPSRQSGDRLSEVAVGPAHTFSPEETPTGIVFGQKNVQCARPRQH